MNKLIKGILIGFISAILVSTSTFAFAQTIQTELKKIIFTVNGKQVSTIANGILYNNEIYLPAKELSKSLNYGYTFNQKTNTVDFTKTNSVIPNQTTQYELNYIRFYESGYDPVGEKFRVYKNEFPKSISRYINWEIEITSDFSDKKRNVALYYIFYRPDGSIYGTGTGSDGQFFIDKDTTETVFSWGHGSSQHGMWDVGTYKVEIYIDKNKIATSSFSIIDDSKIKDEKTEYIASTILLDYSDILRNIEKHKGVNTGFTGQVLSVNEIGNLVHMYVNVSSDQDIYKIISLNYKKSLKRIVY